MVEQTAPKTSPDAELARIRMGEDTTPVEPGVWMTPEQLWHSLLEMHPATRLERLQVIVQWAQMAERCFVEDHVEHIKHLESRD